MTQNGNKEFINGFETKNHVFHLAKTLRIAYTV